MATRFSPGAAAPPHVEAVRSPWAVFAFMAASSRRRSTIGTATTASWGPRTGFPTSSWRRSGDSLGSGLCFPNPTALPASATDDTTSSAFNAWVRSNAKDLLNILFPASLSEGVSGKDAAENHSQQFLLNTAMAFTSGEQNARLRQSEAGALFEFERFGGDGRPGIGLQGIYRMDGVHMSVLGRYSQQSQNGEGPFGATTTRAVTITTDYHPSVVVYPALDLRVGFDARTGLLFSRAAELNLGSLDFGGGAWMSARKDFSRVRIGFSSLVQGSKSYLPIAAENLKFLADAVNDTPVAFDISYGVLGGYALTTRMSLNGKVVQTTPRRLRRAGACELDHPDGGRFVSRRRSDTRRRWIQGLSVRTDDVSFRLPSGLLRLVEEFK